MGLYGAEPVPESAPDPLPNPRPIQASPKTLHKYLYAGGDPVNAKDPTGRGSLQQYAFTLAVIAAFIAENPQNVILKVGEAVCFPIELVNLYLKWADGENKAGGGEGETFPVPPDPIPDLIDAAHEWCEAHIVD